MSMVMWMLVGMGVAGRVLFVPHSSSMARKSRCSTSTPATLVRLQAHRSSHDAALGLG
jgi:hypothetical protein